MPRRKWGFGAGRFLLAVLVIHNFHDTLGSVSNGKQDCFKGYNQHPLSNLHSSSSKKWTKNFFPIKEEKVASTELIGWEEDKVKQNTLPGNVLEFSIQLTGVKIDSKVFNDVSQRGPVTYSILVDKNPNVTVFSIIKTCGLVYVHHPIDREKTPSFSITFDVLNRTNNKMLAKSLNVVIQIQDINDNAPQFSQREFNIIIKGNYHKGENFYRMTAFDSDQKGTANSEVVYSLISQTPRLTLPLFIIDSFSGYMSITQCLDYEANRNFTVLIRASDRGSPPMSSTARVNIAVEDSNYNLPVFTQKYYHADVPEGTSESNILRLKVEDKDSPYTRAWRTKYSIRTGNERGNFDVFTDSTTNEGVLRVAKPLVYGSLSVRRLVIVVENELPFFLCKGGLQPPFSEASVDINITNRNYAPQFIPPVLHFKYQEGVWAGTTLVKYTAHDSGTAQDKIRYKIGFDPSGWLTISEYYGIVKIAKTLGKEYLLMNKTILIQAIDDGTPPLTGTGTIQLYISPSKLIRVQNLTICKEEGLGPFHITSEVEEYNSYARFLTVQLEDAWGRAENLWRLGKSFGNSVELFMLKQLSSGNYSVPLRIQDLQGVFRQQTLNVHVCSCADGIKCESPDPIRAEPITASWGPIIGIIVAIFLLLILSLAILLLYSCIIKVKKKPTYIPPEVGNQSLINYTDESEPVLGDSGGTGMKVMQPTLDPPVGSPSIYTLNRNTTMFQNPRDNTMEGEQSRLYWVNFWQKYNKITPDNFLETVAATLKQKCKQMNNLEDNMVSYRPHVYAEEGTLEKSKSLLSVVVPRDEKNSLPNNLLDGVGFIFDPLRKIYSK